MIDEVQHMSSTTPGDCLMFGLAFQVDYATNPTVSQPSRILYCVLTFDLGFCA